MAVIRKRIKLLTIFEPCNVFFFSELAKENKGLMIKVDSKFLSNPEFYSELKYIYRKKYRNHKKLEGLDEHDILELALKQENLYQFLFFFHWYERKTGIEIIFGRKIIHEIYKEIGVIKIELYDEVKSRMLKHFDSKKHIGFSIIYEHYYNLLSGIEKFSLKEIQSFELATFLAKQFPQLQWVNNWNGIVRRYELKDVRKHEFDRLYNPCWLEYKWTIPIFYPYSTVNEYGQTESWRDLIPISPRKVENELREEMSLPKIGEGWISETHLFYVLKDEFIDEIVLHHGKPKWLGSQHVDIWFPKHKIGVEYQGLQHDKPVEFFGGEKAFLKNQERDERKRRLFKKNNSTLIEVRKGYCFESLVEEINK
jgi:hypothetical protein